MHDIRQDDGLTVPGSVYESMVEWARKHAPVEACGLLSGVAPDVRSFHQMTNADGSPEHFSMVPEEQFAAVKSMRAAGEKLLAIFHSHPATPARPSQEDLRLGLEPGVVHMILSLADAATPVIKGFRIEDEQSTEVPVRVG